MINNLIISPEMITKFLFCSLEFFPKRGIEGVAFINLRMSLQTEGISVFQSSKCY